jgi:hypothetical protein
MQTKPFKDLPPGAQLVGHLVTTDQHTPTPGYLVSFTFGHGMTCECRWTADPREATRFSSVTAADFVRTFIACAAGADDEFAIAECHEHPTQPHHAYVFHLERSAVH